MSVFRHFACATIIGVGFASILFAQLPPNAPVLKRKVDAPPAGQGAVDKAKQAIDAAADKAKNAVDQTKNAADQTKQAVDNAAKAAKAKLAKANDPMTPVADVPGLPRVLLIGDSISIGYTLPVRKLLEGKANVHRPLTNCGPTINGLKSVDAWLKDKRTGGEKWDVIHFNFGLHDLKFADANGKLIQVTSEGKQQVSLEDYEKNLRTIVSKLKATGAKLIWCSTTPVPEGAAGRIPGDEVRYNEVALKVMKDNDVAIDDLYAFAKPKVATIQNKKDVHFSGPGSAELATQVVSTIEAALKK